MNQIIRFIQFIGMIISTIFSIPDKNMLQDRGLSQNETFSNVTLIQLSNETITQFSNNITTTTEKALEEAITELSNDTNDSETTVKNSRSDQKDQIRLANECLGCICTAFSSCYINYCAEGACGPFWIRKPYWIDGGERTVNNQSKSDEDAYKNCALNVECAALTVEAYMNRYKSDCNKDGKINCDDFALIHYLGPFGCNKTENVHPNYWKQYLDCRSYIE